MLLTSWSSILTVIEQANITLAENGRLIQDSRQLVAGDIFVALKGLTQDGAKYIPQAVERGAKVILVSNRCAKQYYQHQSDDSALIIEVDDLELYLPEISKAFYIKQPDELMPIVGITGTNGKTSVSHLLAQISDLSQQRQVAVIGTMGTGRLDNLVSSANTTPGVTDVYRLIHTFSNDKNADFCALAMEVSSHALEQNRVKGLNFEVAVFTNLTHDHLDYHGTMESYFESKAKLFVDYQPKCAVINLDDDYGQRLAALTPDSGRNVVYGQTELVKSYPEYVYIQNVVCHPHGLSIELEWLIDGMKEHTELQVPIYGAFNSSNLAAVFATAKVLGWPLHPMAFSQLTPVPGRLELFVKPKMPVAIVDYAHTPDALEQSIKSVKKHMTGDLYVVFGCGGDRDAGKRPIMADIAERYADRVIVTNDNPRTEDPNHIVKDILAGFTEPDAHEVILERKQAIEYALTTATENDAVLIAGKGHETYQVVGDKVIDYDERAFTARIVTQLAQQKS